MSKQFSAEFHSQTGIQHYMQGKIVQLVHKKSKSVHCWTPSWFHAVNLLKMDLSSLTKPV